MLSKSFRAKTLRALFSATALSTLGMFCMLTPTAAHAETETQAAHDPADVWNLSALYPSDAAWQAEYERLRAEVPTLAQYEDSFDRTPQTMLTALSAMSKTRKALARLSVYASLKADEDTRVQDNLARDGLANQLWTRYSEATSWLGPVVLDMGSKTVEKYLEAEPRLQPHAFSLRETLRRAEHMLDADGEEILSAAGDFKGGAGRIYNQLANSDMPWPVITFTTGETVTLNQAAYSKWRQAENRKDRQRTFDAFWGQWGEFESTLGESLKTHLQGHVFTARMRKYGSSLEAAMDRDALPTTVYDTLISETHKGLPTLHRYLKLRARMLEIDDQGYHDVYVDLVKDDSTYDVATSKDLTRVALEPFGPVYLEALEKGFAGQWMHVRPQDGKRSGAYMNGSAYDVHPYVLLNHQDDYDSLSTFAHEWGHAVHSVLANAAQPYETARYATFVAETASIINEILLVEHMIKHAETPQKKLYFLNAAVEMLRGTYFRQAQLAEFERAAYQRLEAGEATTGSTLSEMYLDLLRTYYGEAEGVMTIDPDYAVEWAYIPHFYYNYYVYQYATSMAGSVVLAERLLAGDTSQQARFIKALQEGGSRHPYEILKDAGADLATPTPYQAVVTRMNRLLDEMERTLSVLERQNR